MPMYVQWSTSTPLSDMSLGANAASVAQLSASPSTYTHGALMSTRTSRPTCSKPRLSHSSRFDFKTSSSSW